MTFFSYRANCSRDAFFSCILCLYANQINRPESRNHTDSPVYLNDTKFRSLVSNLPFATLEIQNFSSKSKGKFPKRGKLWNAHEYIRKVRFVTVERECANNEKAEH